MQSDEIRQQFLNFFKKNGHAVVPSSSLIPDDPSVLLTTAGMQQFKKYFTGELDAQKTFGAKSTASVQKCFRTSDIDEVGDESHLTFFEMLGNFSFASPSVASGEGRGGYFSSEGGSASGGKKEAIRYAYDFVVKEMKLKIDYVTVFAGEADVPADTESEKIWKSLDASIVVRKAGRADNFWGPTGNEGPCGPTTEIYVNGVEIWNIVFNQYYQHSDKRLEPLKTPGIDTGMGLERLAMVAQKKDNIFETDLFAPLMEILPLEMEIKAKRVIADHLRAAVFLIADGVRPSNKEAGYILRRLLRRILAYQNIYDIHADIFVEGFETVKTIFQTWYPEVKEPRILEVMEAEKDKFEAAIVAGVGELRQHTAIDAVGSMRLYTTFGLPFELQRELAPEATKDLKREDFDEQFKQHQEISRAGAEKKFGGHGLLLDTGELKAKDETELKKVTRLHTATHMLQTALRKVLGPEVKQMGSDITAERTRFDFTFVRKLTPAEIKQVEEIINVAINQDLPVGFIEMPKPEAEKTGALFFFKQKYPERVKVYYIGHSIPEAFSKEFCGGPHVTHTLEIGKFRIAKEEAVGAGVRRIRGVVEP